MNQKYLLGKIFLSYSSLDKPFVRRLSSRLKKDGYDVWLDEKELTPGDKLASELANAIEESIIFIIIISENSIKSKWLKYELELALKRMVENEIRLIPLLKGNIDLPNQLKGLVYADFRNNKRTGYKTILKSLENEIPKVLSKSNFWSQVQYLLDVVFDGKGSMGYSKGSDFGHCQTLRIKNIESFESDFSLAFTIIPDDQFSYFDDIIKKEYILNHENIPVKYFLLIYEKFHKKSSHQNFDRIQINELESSFVDFFQVEIIVDMSGLKSFNSRKSILMKTKKLIINHFKESK